MKNSLNFAAAGLLTAVIFASSPAAAQAPDAADRCMPDVMRLCSEFVPDPDRIVACLKAKRRQLTPSCLSALTPGASVKNTKSTNTKSTNTKSTKTTKKKQRPHRPS